MNFDVVNFYCIVRDEESQARSIRSQTRGIRFQVERFSSFKNAFRDCVVENSVDAFEGAISCLRCNPCAESVKPVVCTGTAHRSRSSRVAAWIS